MSNLPGETLLKEAELITASERVMGWNLLQKHELLPRSPLLRSGQQVQLGPEERQEIMTVLMIRS